MRDIGKNIKTLRTGKNMTQDELAEKLFVTRQTVSNYETGRSRPDVDMLAKIAEVLETDVNSLIYGPAPAPEKAPVRSLMAGYGIAVGLVLLRKFLEPYTNVFRATYFSLGPSALIYALLDPLIWFFAGWSLIRMVTMALKKGPLKGRWVPYLRRVLAIILIAWLLLSIPYLTLFALDDYLYCAKLRGEMVDEFDGETLTGKSWQPIPLPGLDLLEPIGIPVMQFNIRHPWSLGILGAALMLCGFPRKQSNKM